MASGPDLLFWGPARLTDSVGFVLNVPSFSIGSPASWETPQSWAN